ncbi:MAG TPA: hemolysin family protein [Herpetosiphonaceae bacterium]|nr:hemolysin family protein [Herpetosiphonaceae bacterium]
MEESLGVGAISLRLLAVAVLVVANGFFVAAEFALVSARRSKLDQAADGGSAPARLARVMQEHLDRYIAACQLGITIASLLLGALAEPTFARLIEPPVVAVTEALFGVFGGSEVLATTISHALGVAVSLFIVTTLHIVLGEQAPKVWAIRSPEGVAMFVARPLRIFNSMFGLIIRFLDWLTGLVLRLFGVRGSSGHHGPPTLEELRLMIESSAAGGVMERDEQELLINAFDFGSRAAYQVVVPRIEVATIEATATVREFLGLFRATGHTRFPVLGEGGVDDVQGIISAKDLLVALGDGGVLFEQPIAPLVRSAFFAPETNRVSDLLPTMQKQRARMAVLVDEYGGMAGIVTLEDLVEEIVGELDDELDTIEVDIETVDEHTTIVEGSIRIAEANHELELALPEGEYETVAGLLLERLGRLPQEGEQLQIDGVALTVLEMHGPRISRVQIIR